MIENVATRDYVGEQTALVEGSSPSRSARCGRSLRSRSARCGGLAEQIGAVRRELAEGLSEIRTELICSINRLAFWMNGFLAALLIAVLGVLGVLIGKL